MKAYHGDVKIKKIYIARMRAHMEADELIRRVGFENGRGCAVGCILNKYDHGLAEKELGIPEWCMILLDFLHENTSDEVWPTLALSFLEAIPVSANLNLLENTIKIFILKSNIERVEDLSIRKELKEEVVGAINKVINFLENCYADESAARSAWAAAESAAWAAAESAASSAAESAAWAAAESAASSAADSAAWASESAASSAAWATARAAAKSAESAASSAARSAARSAESDKIAMFFIDQLKSTGI